MSYRLQSDSDNDVRSSETQLPVDRNLHKPNVSLVPIRRRTRMLLRSVGDLKMYSSTDFLNLRQATAVCRGLLTARYLFRWREESEDLHLGNPSQFFKSYNNIPQCNLFHMFAGATRDRFYKNGSRERMTKWVTFPVTQPTQPLFSNDINLKKMTSKPEVLPPFIDYASWNDRRCSSPIRQGIILRITRWLNDSERKDH